MGSSEGKEGLIPVAIKEYDFNLFSPKTSNIMERQGPCGTIFL